MSTYYDQVAKRYDAHRRAGGPYIEALLDLASAHRGARLLEIAAGTANHSALLTEKGMQPFACDQSLGMIARGRSKALPIRWTRCNVAALPYTNSSFGFVFGAYFLHHISDLSALFRECARVLDGGVLVLITVPEAFIRDHPMRPYFPSIPLVDLPRFQPISQIVEAMATNGFQDVESRNYVDQPKPVDAAYVEKVANRFISTYDLIPAEEFEAGLARLRSDVDKQGVLPLNIAREATLVWGRSRP